MPPKRMCSACGGQPAKLLRCSGCKENAEAVRYCNKKCQKRHFAQHKADCNLCNLKLQADEAGNLYTRRNAEASTAQLNGDMRTHLRLMSEATQHAIDAAERYKKLGPRASGMELELCSNIALGLARVKNYEGAEKWLDRAFAAVPAARAVDISEPAYWAAIGTRICGEKDNIDPETGHVRPTRESWDTMITLCEAYAWKTRNQIHFFHARDGGRDVECGVCCERVTGLTTDVSHVEILPCRHVAHAKCLPAGYERARVVGYIAPGTSSDIGVCQLCVRTGQTHGVQAGSFQDLVKAEDERAEVKTLQKKLKRLFGKDINEFDDPEEAAKVIENLPTQKQQLEALELIQKYQTVLRKDLADGDSD